MHQTPEMPNNDAKDSGLDGAVEQLLSRLLGSFSLTYLVDGKARTIGDLPGIVMPAHYHAAKKTHEKDIVRPNRKASSNLDTPNGSHLAGCPQHDDGEARMLHALLSQREEDSSLSYRGQHNSAAYFDALYLANTSIDASSDDRYSSLSPPQSRGHAPTQGEQNSATGFDFQEDSRGGDVWHDVLGLWNVNDVTAEVEHLCLQFRDLMNRLYYKDARKCASEFLAGLYPERRRIYSFRKGCKLPYWPQGVRYVDPYHTTSRERADLLVWLLLNPHHDTEAIDHILECIQRKLWKPDTAKILVSAAEILRKKLEELGKSAANKGEQPRE